jgi:hypothetical protein
VARVLGELPREDADTVADLLDPRIRAEAAGVSVGRPVAEEPNKRRKPPETPKYPQQKMSRRKVRQQRQARNNNRLP